MCNTLKYTHASWLVFGLVPFNFFNSLNLNLFIYLFFKRFYLFNFLERGREGERDEEKHQCAVASHVSPTGDLAWHPGTCPDWELNQWPFFLQASAQSTELHQPRLFIIFTVFFPLPFSSPILPFTPPPQLPHCCPCPWVLFPFCSVLPP